MIFQAFFNLSRYDTKPLESPTLPPIDYTFQCMACDTMMIIWVTCNQASFFFSGRRENRGAGKENMASFFKSSVLGRAIGGSGKVCPSRERLFRRIRRGVGLGAKLLFGEREVNGWIFSVDWNQIWPSHSFWPAFLRLCDSV